MTNDLISQLQEDMRSNGFDVADIECGDGWKRFARRGETKKNCYYSANMTRLAGTEILSCCYGDWKTHEQYLFRSSPFLDKTQRSKIKDAQAKLKLTSDQHTELNQRAAMEMATNRWARGKPHGKCQYLTKKKIDKLHGARILGIDLLVPIIDVQSKLIGLQTITPRGEKFFLKGQKAKGGFHVIGGFDQLEDAAHVYVAEGFATGCAVRMAINAPVVCAFSAGNLWPVCEVLKKAFPFLKLTICADNDQFTDGNPGHTKGAQAAQKFNAKFVMPTFNDVSTKPTDFDDLYRLQGIEAVKAQLKMAAYFEADIPPSVQLAEEFILDRKYRRGNDLFLRSWQERFYAFMGEAYRLMSEGDLFAEVMSFIQNHSGARAKAGTNMANNLIANLKGLTNLPAINQMPSWIDGSGRDSKSYIALQNGIFDVSRWLKGGTDVIGCHSQNLFSTVCLPFAYDPQAQCPTWTRFLAEVQPNSDMRRLLQEWAGLNLVHDTSFCKFMLLVGEGANGKTVFCVVLRCLLGPENVSAVNLEGFDPKRTFQIAATCGKLANIVGELNQVDRAAEGELKKFIAGELITAERKYEHPFEFLPTVRLTFATNILPRFTDASDGLWRRLLLVPFSVQIKDEAKQDKNLVNPDWWTTSGELPGVFNWALQGLRSLYQRGHFVEPEDSRAAKENYRQDSNPTRTFLNDNCEHSPGVRIASSTLYEAYSRDLKEGGHFPLSRTAFALEVKRAFPQVELTKHAQNQGISRSKSRNWVGLCVKI